MEWFNTGSIKKEYKFSLPLGSAFNIEDFKMGSWKNPVFITSMKNYFSKYLMDNRIQIVGEYPNYTIEAIGKFEGNHMVDVYVIDSGGGTNTNTSEFKTVFNVGNSVKNKKVFELKKSNNWTFDISEINSSFENIDFYISFKKINFDLNTCGYEFVFNKVSEKLVSVTLIKKNSAIVTHKIKHSINNGTSFNWSNSGSPFYFVSVGNVRCTASYQVNEINSGLIYSGGIRSFMYYNPDLNSMSLRCTIASYTAPVTFCSNVKINYLDTNQITNVSSNDFEIIVLAVGDI